ncbi:MAG: threonine aldolase family protein [Rhodospirillaceae bacterium]|nr:threonine aldolase family protein [Rhodospirillaceae bacterium]MBT6139497.1 threonine aldolase family protein [Rhodospirillaceae bacterium]
MAARSWATPAHPRIDLYSDTITKPTPEMRRAMAEAEVGNEQSGEDPTVNALCRMVAELTGKPDALFLPSGTMCNQIAYRVWCDRGEEILLEENSHMLHYEAGATAALTGAMSRTIQGTRGMFTAEDLKGVMHSASRHTQKQVLVSVENTTNRGGGAVWPLEQLRKVSETAHEAGMNVHMDGARLMNAVVSSGIPARDFAAEVDSVWIDLSKGLGCPVGAVLAGSEEFIERAWLFKHQYGGAMRQAGIIAAAGVYAFENHVERLAEDHENARRLARGLADIEGIAVNPNECDTNILFFDVGGLGVSAADFSARLRAEHDIRIGHFSATSLRAVTGLDISEADIDEAIAACKAVAGG